MSCRARARIIPVLKAAACLLLAVPAVPAISATHEAGGTRDVWESLRYDDLRLGAIVYRLAAANAALCDPRESSTGLILQAIDQFPESLREPAKAAFHFDLPLAVEAVVPGSPAAAAGILQNDDIESINGSSFATALPSQIPTTALRDQALSLIGRADPELPLAITLIRNGQRLLVHVRPVMSCRARAELIMRGGTIAQSDDKTIQIGSKFVERWSDDDLVVLVAHEMAHIVLKHGERLEGAGVNHGIFAEFGGNGAAIRAAEDEADRYSVDLLRNAGYDPQIGPRFWLKGAGRSIDHGILRNGTHGSPAQRATIMQDEIARLDHPARN